MPRDWTEIAWKAAGGYGSQGNSQGRDNASRERLYFSPNCLKLPTLFDEEFLVALGAQDAIAEEVMARPEDQG